MINDSLIKQITFWLKIIEKKHPEIDIKEAIHFLEHNEYEIAFEICLLEMMKKNIMCSHKDKKELNTIALECNLDKDYSFMAGYTWKKLQEWKDTTRYFSWP